MLVPRARRADDSESSLAHRVALLAGCAVAQLEALCVAQLGLRFVVTPALHAADAQFSVLSFTDCVSRAVLPVREASGTLYIVDDPWDERLLRWLSNRIGCYPDLAWGDRDAILAALELSQQRLKASSGLGIAALHEGGGATDMANVISIETIERTTSAVVRFVDAAIYDAWNSGASDIHFECDRTGVTVKLRLDGVLVETAALPDRARAEEVISRIKVLAQLDIAEQRVPQDGRFRARLGARELDFRVSIMPSIFGEDAVVRLLDKSQLRGAAMDISLASLGIDADASERIRKLSRRPHGMLLVTGPTGSGKTTTLYAALSEIRTGQEKIITIEDPVEYELPGVLQIPVNEKKGLTFSQGLRSILRHDPDKILVGEIRDSETAEIAVQAALTGHLVLTTVHANSVYDVISRFAHMKLDLHSLTSALNGVVAQRLIRRICPACSETTGATSELSARLASVGLAPLDARPARGRGCEHCRGTGYKGRHAIAEVLPFDDTLRALVLRRADVREIKQHAEALGVVSLVKRALELVAQGATTLEEIDRVIAYE
ncbi:general secretion pathway protein GspE [Pseudoduganella armeniaca]|uniref:General secretion pathway protein GspE n=2 Tax=Pseudoduganella armeniaca TaxID=2072590 RepID=A0A2R4CAU1_9BURK|nr:general secretion pathway protein GspE [Pseudoduganella armeniaca]